MNDVARASHDRPRPKRTDPIAKAVVRIATVAAAAAAAGEWKAGKASEGKANPKSHPVKRLRTQASWAGGEREALRDAQQRARGDLRKLVRFAGGVRPAAAVFGMPHRTIGQWHEGVQPPPWAGCRLLALWVAILGLDGDGS